MDGQPGTGGGVVEMVASTTYLRGVVMHNTDLESQLSHLMYPKVLL